MPARILIFYKCGGILIFMSRTHQPKKRKRARTHGFLKRSRTIWGRRTLKRRRQKGRRRIAL